MLTIRKKQIQAMRPALVRRFLEKLLQHIRTFFEAECEGRSDEELLEHIQRALERAGAYGLVAERDLFQYVNVSMLHGPDFDQQPETTWTRDFLTDEDVPDPGQRMDRLFQEVVHRLEVVEQNARLRDRFYSRGGR